MPSMEPAEKYMFIRVPVARRALSILLEAKIHPHFAGYLALCQTARRTGRTLDLRFTPKEFFDHFLRVADLPDQTPYIQPFHNSPGRKIQFFNSNVAGSYAPSSLRSVAPFRQVATYTGSGLSSTIALVPDHAQQAKKVLSFGKKVDVTALAIFLYRDYGIGSEGASCGAVVSLFRDDFGFGDSAPEGLEAFSVLFEEKNHEFDDLSPIFGLGSTQ